MYFKPWSEEEPGSKYDIIPTFLPRFQEAPVRFFIVVNMAGLRREDLMPLSPSDLAEKLTQVGLLTTLIQSLEG